MQLVIVQQLIKKKLQSNILKLFKQADVNGDGVISGEEFTNLFKAIILEYPQLQFYSTKINQMFQEADTNRDGVLSLEEFTQILNIADNKLKSLPSTAQVASQQGYYLGKFFNSKAKGVLNFPNFEYQHFGQFAYVGNQVSVADLPSAKLGGFATWWLWRSAYIYNQHSLRNQWLVFSDWMKAWIFGRDVSRF